MSDVSASFPELVVPAYRMTFVESATPVAGPVTKFGGQPTWLGAPAWPIGAEFEEPMTFICQLALDPEMFPWIDQFRMAYVFNSGMDADGLWDPFSGENAVIVQPGRAHSSVAVVEQATGPTLSRGEGGPTLEFAVELEAGADPAWIAESDLSELGDDARDAYSEALQGDRLGGTPYFLQGDEFPDWPNQSTRRDPAGCHHVLDLASDLGAINLGDGGVAHVFLTPDCEEGAWLWQCH